MAALRAHASVTETGESAYAVRMVVGGHVLTGDEAVDAGGGGLGPAPFEMLSAALAECTAMTIRWYARQEGWPVERVQVSVAYSKKQFAGASAATDAFEKTISIQGLNLTDEQRTRLLDIAARCPVQRTLEGGAAVMTVAEPPELSDRKDP